MNTSEIDRAMRHQAYNALAVDEDAEYQKWFIEKCQPFKESGAKYEFCKRAWMARAALAESGGESQEVKEHKEKLSLANEAVDRWRREVAAKDALEHEINEIQIRVGCNHVEGLAKCVKDLLDEKAESHSPARLAEALERIRQAASYGMKQSPNTLHTISQIAEKALRAVPGDAPTDEIHPLGLKAGDWYLWRRDADEEWSGPKQSDGNLAQKYHYRRCPAPPAARRGRRNRKEMTHSMAEWQKHYPPDGVKERIPFNLTRALRGDALVTRDGREAFKFHQRGSGYLAEIQGFGIGTYNSEGKYYRPAQNGNSPLDLFLRAEG